MNKLKKGLIAISICAPLVLGCAGMAHAEEQSLIVNKEYRTPIKDEDGKLQFKDTLEKDGIHYRLKSITINDIEEIHPGDVFTYESIPFVGNPEKYAPVRSVEKEGKNYTLKSSEIKDITTSETTKYSESTIFYKGVEYIDTLPEVAEVKVTDEDLNQELEVSLPAVDYKEEGTYWDYNFTFPVTVTGYNLDSYMLGKTEIPNGSPLIDHGDEFLNYLKLPSKYYEITRIEWAGEPIQKNGDTIRNATAYGRKLVRDITGVYGGEVTYPSTQAKVYHGFYVEDDAENQTDQVIYRKEATATYEAEGKIGLWDYLKNLLDFIIGLIRNHPILSISIGILIVIFAVVLIIDELAKKQSKKEVIKVGTRRYREWNIKKGLLQKLLKRKSLNSNKKNTGKNSK